MADCERSFEVDCESGLEDHEHPCSLRILFFQKKSDLNGLYGYRGKHDHGNLGTSSIERSAL